MLSGPECYAPGFHGIARFPTATVLRRFSSVPIAPCLSLFCKMMRATYVDAMRYIIGCSQLDNRMFASPGALNFPVGFSSISSFETTPSNERFITAASSVSAGFPIP